MTLALSILVSGTGAESADTGSASAYDGSACDGSTVDGDASADAVNAKLALPMQVLGMLMQVLALSMQVLPLLMQVLVLVLSIYALSSSFSPMLALALALVLAKQPHVL